MDIKTSWSANGSKPVLLVLAVFLLATAIFLPTLSYDFVWDDFHEIIDNPQIKSFSNWPRFLVSNVYYGQPSSYYRPLKFFSLSLDYALFKDHPRGYHFTNLILHGINASLVAYLAWLLFQNSYAALIAGALFALHPVHPEAVAYIAARAELLYTLFSLLALVSIIKKAGRHEYLGPGLLAPLFFLLALLSKETSAVVLIPMALWLYRKNQENSKKLRTVILKIAPSSLVLAVYLFLRYLNYSIPLTTKYVFSFFYSPFFLFELFIRYVSFLIFPPQQAPYLYNVPRPYAYPLDFKFWMLAGLTTLLLTLIFYGSYRKKETAPFFALIILPCLPSLYFNISINVMMIDRHLYLPTAGLALLAAWSILQAPAQRKKWIAGGMALILVSYAGATFWRMQPWKNEVTLFEALKKESPAAPYVRGNLGIVYQNQNRLLEAYREFYQVIVLDPQDFVARSNLGWVCLRLGRTLEAREAFSEALRLSSQYVPALEGMGMTCWQEGNKAEALEYLDKALLIDPKNKRFQRNKELILAEGKPFQ